MEYCGKSLRFVLEVYYGDVVNFKGVESEEFAYCQGLQFVPEYCSLSVVQLVAGVDPLL